MSVLAAPSTASQVYPGLIGFLVVAGMGLALFFLFRSHEQATAQGRAGPAVQCPARPVPAAAGRARRLPRYAGRNARGSAASGITGQYAELRSVAAAPSRRPSRVNPGTG